ncbi:MAG: S8 family serine peptidase [Clostridia bacterium]|nr:S8 family serine peptidase [Clostridia bacterium]
MNKVLFNNSGKLKEAIKKIVTFVVAIIFVPGCTLMPGTGFLSEAHAEESGPDYVEGEVIVCYIDTDDMDLTLRQERKADRLLGDAEEITTLENVSLADVSVDESKLTAGVQNAEEVDKTIATVSSDEKSTEELIEEIEKLPNVDYVEPNYIFRLCDEEVEEEPVTEASEAEAETPEAETDAEEPAAEVSAETTADDHTSEQWGFTENYGLNIPDWNNPENVNADGVVVVMDSGVNYSHEDLDDVMWTSSKGYHGIDLIDDDNYPMDDNGHGSHCAGIIAAEWNDFGVSGAANGVKIMAIKAADEEGYLDYGDILTGYEYLIDQKEQGVDIVAVNNSWGGGAESSYGINDLVSQAGKLGIVSVFSSGNKGLNCDTSYSFSNGTGKFTGHYFCYFLKDNPYAITVNSIGLSTEETDSCLMSGFSNYGAKTTDLAAPGTGIISTVLNNNYQCYSGTSMAAPAVTGEAAIVSTCFPDETADVIASIITHNTLSSSCVKGKCKSNGLANVAKALKAKPKDIKYRDFRLKTKEYTYDGKEKKPAVLVSGLEKGTDYEVIYPAEATRDAGTYSVLVNGLGIYDGSIELTYKIRKATPKASLKSVSYTYNGETKKNALSVTDQNGVRWIKDTDYRIKGKLSAKLPGKYSVSVVPIDSKNYNAVKKSYRISVGKTGIYKLSPARGAFTVRVEKRAKKYVSGYQFRYSLKSDMSKAKIRTVGNRYDKTSRKLGKLKRNTKYYVQVRTYKTINGTRYHSAWGSTKAVKTR